MDTFLKQLTSLRTTRPRPEYVTWSRAEILRTTPVRHRVRAQIFQYLQLGSTMALASLLLVILFNGVSLIPGNARHSARIDFQRLVAEAEELSIDVKIAELNRYAATKQSVDAALESAAETVPGQLSIALLEREQGSTRINNKTASSEEITSGLSTLIE